MASDQASLDLSCSSTSSDGARSNRGTPETKVTALSPDDVRFSLKRTVSAADRTVAGPPGFTLEPSQYQLPRFLDDVGSSQSSAAVVDATGQLAIIGNLTDPFVTTTRAQRHSTEQKLSPTASCFTPASGYGDQTGRSDGGGSPAGNAEVPSGSKTNGSTQSPTTDAGSNAETDRYRACVANGSTPFRSSASAESSSGSGATGRIITIAAHGAAEFRDDLPVVQSLVIQVYPVQEASTLVQLTHTFITVEVPRVVQGHTAIDSTVPGTFIMGFSTMDDCDAVIQATLTSHPQWSVKHVTPRQLFEMYEQNDLSPNGNDTLVRVTVSVDTPSGRASVESVKPCLPQLLEDYGRVLHSRGLNAEGTEFLCLLAGFTREDVALADAFPLNHVPFEGGHLRLTHVQRVPDTSTSAVPTRVGQNSWSNASSSRDVELEQAFANMSIGADHAAVHGPGRHGDGVEAPYWSAPSRVAVDHLGRPSTGYEYMTPILPATVNHGLPYVPVPGALRLGNSYQARPPGVPHRHGAMGQDRYEPAQPRNQQGRSLQHRRAGSGASARRAGAYVSAPHNVVDIERISRGLDVRTTIMLRNIPNKIDQPMLKEIVDETSRGKYDFMYLRIDFANNCNVGYAFINFEDPYFIIDFVKARAGYRWNRFNSDKVAEVSYATIQGKDCLVQKFRNSSVMLELPSFRPKVFHTGTGPLAGTEEVFPEPDNLSKMRRSVENAAHVGLFSPGGGQNPRYDQRRRRSQYDRGTRLAQMEEAYAFNRGEFPRIPGFLRLPGVPEVPESQDEYRREHLVNHGHSQGFGFTAHGPLIDLHH